MNVLEPSGFDVAFQSGQGQQKAMREQGDEHTRPNTHGVNELLNIARKLSVFEEKKDETD